MSAAFSIDLKDASTFPSRRNEAWKYSDLKRLLREAPEASVSADVTSEGPFASLDGETIVLSNGQAVGATEFIASGEQTLRLRYVSNAENTGHSARVTVSAPAGSRLLLLESHEGVGSAYVAHDMLELDVADGAEVVRVVLVDEPEDAISVIEAQVRVAAGGTFRQTVIATGAKLQRIETRIEHNAQGAHVQADGLYLLNGSRHTDMTSVVRHIERDGTTSQVIKGVARDTSRGVFQGKIVVERGADGTDARMGHHSLITGERAEIDAKPELIIYADDVQCAHGNTIGTLDESALFYMQSRGLSAEEARALLTQAFLIEVIDRISDEAAREVARDWLTARL